MPRSHLPQISQNLTPQRLLDCSGRPQRSGSRLSFAKCRSSSGRSRFSNIRPKWSDMGVKVAAAGSCGVCSVLGGSEDVVKSACGRWRSRFLILRGRTSSQRIISVVSICIVRNNCFITRTLPVFLHVLCERLQLHYCMQSLRRTTSVSVGGALHHSLLARIASPNISGVVLFLLLIGEPMTFSVSGCGFTSLLTGRRWRRSSLAIVGQRRCMTS